MFGFFNKAKKKSFFHEFRGESKEILSDIFFVYKNFIHWNISKVIILIWSMILGILVTLPFFLITIIIGSIDPISWLPIISYILTGVDVSLELLGNLGQHPYWVVTMVFLIASCIIIFLLASSYTLLLQARLIFHYIHKKKLAFKENLYFSRQHISTFMGLLCWNMTYLIAPAFIGLSGILGLYYLYDILGFIPFSVFSFLSIVWTLLCMVFMSFVIYNILFGYIILAHEKEKKVSRSRSYLQKSIKITSLRNFFKFIIVLILYSILMSPFQGIQSYMDQSLRSMKDALYYKAGQVDTIKPEEKKYFEYISAEYKDVTANKLIHNITLLSYFNIFYFFLSFFVFGGLFVVVVVSFYQRVLLQK